MRERVSFSREELPEALPRLAEEVGEGVILSTCNRTEIYTVAEEPEQTAADVLRFLVEYHGVDPQPVAARLYNLRDADAVRHLFKVACGLDSMILGESQILGQLRQALRASSDAYSLRAPVSRLFHRAIRTGRRAREETDLGRNALSISYAAVRLTQRVLGDLSGLRVLLIGAGEAGKLVAGALRTTGAGELIIANRTHERSEELARSLNGRAIRFSEVGSALADADIVIAATEAPDYVISSDTIASARDGRGDRELFVFDLSVPRNVEPDAASQDGVTLFNIDDLSSIAEENLEERKEAASDAEAIVEEEVEGFLEWWGSLDAVPLIKALRRQADHMRRRELNRALRKLSDMSPQETEVVDALTRSIVNKLLHEPTMSLKQRGSDEHLRAVWDLFRLSDDLD